MEHAARSVVEEFEPYIVFLLNGLFGAERVIREVALSRGVRAPTYEIAPRGGALVLSQDALSSYALVEISDLLLTYTTTVGLEAAARGKQVAVAGDTHYRGRGFTTDIAGPSDLERVLAREAAPLPAETVELAIRYAHMFFFRAMIPFPLLEVRDGKVVRFPKTAAEIAPGADPTWTGSARASSTARPSACPTSSREPTSRSRADLQALPGHGRRP